MALDQIKKAVWNADNTDGILNYGFKNGLPFWIVVRYEVFAHLLDRNGTSNSASHTSGLKGKFKHRLGQLRHFYLSFKHRPSLKKQKFDCVDFCSSLATFEQMGCYQSRITGFLDEVHGLSALHVYRSHVHEYKSKYCGNYCFLDYLILKQIIRKKFKNKNTATEASVKSFLEILKNVFKEDLSQVFLQELSERLLDIGYLLPGFECSIRSLLKKTKPKLVLVEDGNYGSWIVATIIKVSKELNIKTAEVQHGTFDLAFQYGEHIISQKKFSDHKTDYVLTFGQFFTEFIKSSSINRNLGNYFFQKKMAEAGSPSAKEIGTNLLFISQLHYTYPILPILENFLEDYQQSFKLVVRLHPSERLDVGKFKKIQDHPNVNFSQRENLYDLMRQADYVIGLHSTALYEAVMMGKPVLIYKNDLTDELIPEELGERFSDARELLSLIENRQVMIPDSHRFLEKDLFKNFEEFWQKEIA